MNEVWKKITIDTDTEGSELIADAFFSIGSNGVEILDKNDIQDIINEKKMWEYVDESLLQNATDTVKVSGFVSAKSLDKKLDELKKLLKNYGIECNITITNICSDLWYESWKKHYKPILAGDFVVVPEWLSYPNTKGLTQIKIDPGMAFGTGEHESTKICLELMSKIQIKNKAVIDVGCGSGILGIGAIKKHAKRCYMCDIDSIAVQAAEKNARLNGIENAEIELTDLIEKDITADIIVANLTADILIRLSKNLKKHLAKKGKIICSGIIESRLEEILDAFLTAGFDIIEISTLGEWRGILAEVK